MLAADTVTTQVVLVGGALISLPAPTADLQPVSEEAKSVMSRFVASNSTLIAGYMLSNDIRQLSLLLDMMKGPSSASLDVRCFSKYAMVTVIPTLEKVDFTPEVFRKVVARLSLSLPEWAKHVDLTAASEDLKRRVASVCESLDMTGADVELGRAVPLGCFFSSKNSFGYGIAAPIAIGGKTVRMATCVILVRAKNRLLKMSLVAQYESPETVMWLSKVAEHWAKSILEANE
jgi:hypothetical protein